MTPPGIVTALGVAAAVLGAPALAGELDVQVTTVRASQQGQSDAQLVELRPRLRRLVGYRAYRVIRDERRRCNFGAHEAFVIPGGRLLRVVPKGVRDETVLMQIQLMDGGRALVDTDVRLQNRGTMLFGVNQQQFGPDDEALIIMVRAED